MKFRVYLENNAETVSKIASSFSDNPEDLTVAWVLADAMDDIGVNTEKLRAYFSRLNEIRERHENAISVSDIETARKARLELDNASPWGRSDTTNHSRITPAFVLRDQKILQDIITKIYYYGIMFNMMNLALKIPTKELINKKELIKLMNYMKQKVTSGQTLSYIDEDAVNRTFQNVMYGNIPVNLRSNAFYLLWNEIYCLFLDLGLHSRQLS